MKSMLTALSLACSFLFAACQQPTDDDSSLPTSPATALHPQGGNREVNGFQEACHYEPQKNDFFCVGYWEELNGEQGPWIAAYYQCGNTVSLDGKSVRVIDLNSKPRTAHEVAVTTITGPASSRNVGRTALSWEHDIPCGNSAIEAYDGSATSGPVYIFKDCDSLYEE